MRRRLLMGIQRLRSTYWFLPAVLTVAAVVLSVAFTTIDRGYPEVTAWLGWAYGGGAHGARALLSAVAGSIVTVVSVTFSVMVVALTVSSQHFGPRLLRSFMRDQPAQLVLGIFTGTFAYCVMVLRTVRGDDSDQYSQFVPHLAVAGAIALALLSVGLLIYYVHHVAVSMQVSEIANRITRELERTIDRLFPEPIGEGTEPPARRPPPIPPDAARVTAPTSGYVQDVGSDEVLGAASDHETTIWLTAAPGDFVIEGDQIAAVHPPPREPKRCARQVARAYSIGLDRDTRQDAAFGVQQLVEMALRALSPGMNEPFTAITSIDRLGQALRKLAVRHIPSALRTDDAGTVRVVTTPTTFDGLLDAAFVPIALYAGRNPAIYARLLDALERLAKASRRPADRDAIARVADVVRAAAGRALEDERDRHDIFRRHEEVQRTLAERRSAEPPTARAS